MKILNVKYLRLASAALLLSGILLNPWVIGKLVAPDGHIESLGVRVFIIAIETLLIGFGVAIYFFHSWAQKYWRQILLSVCSTIISLVALEVGARIFVSIKYHFFPPNRSRESYYGWVSEPNLNYTRKQPGYGVVHYSTKQNGFRRWGDVATSRPKLFAIGDSYTQAYTVSDGEAYYDHIAHEFPNVEIYAYGCGGYGTLQEYMIMDKYIDVIRPNIILWQFCSNDVIDNSVELESKSYFNPHLRRPYLRNGRIEWLVPDTNLGFIYDLAQSSYILRLVCNLQLDSMRGRMKHWLEKDYEQESTLCREAAQTTYQIMKMVRDRAKKVPIVAFSTNEAPWVGNAYIDICKKLNIDYLDGVAATIDKQKAEGKIVDGMPIDSHWNAVGHAIAGKMITDYLHKKYPQIMQ